jgi:glycosyltransferase involved in cell wall biosynthesis
VKAFLIESFEVFSKQKVVVVHYGYDFDEVLDAESSENIWETRQLKVLSIGRLVPQKDIGTLLKGIQISYSRGVSLTVSIVGEGPLRTELVSLNTDLGLDGVVNFLPKTADTDSLYRWADLFVLSSVYEGFGLVLLEAINHDLPIICSRSSAAWEVLGDDYVGFFEVGNPKALANKLLDFAGLRQTMVDKLRLRKKYFSSRRMSMEIEMVYKAIMD